MNPDNITKDDGYLHFNMIRDKITDSWNSKYMKEMRLKMIKGEKHSNCQRCYLQEDLGHSSMRDTKGMADLIKNTNPDGSYDTAPWQLELHFGNLCNLACKMCSQNYSTAIGKELIKMGHQDPDFLKWVKKESGTVNNWTGQLDMVYDWFKNEKIKKEVFEHVSKNVTRLNVIGGEPTIIKEFFELLDYCYQDKTLGDKQVLIHSNMTNTNPKLTDWLGEMESWSIVASIDGVGDRNRYIRYPSDWDTIVKNINFYNEIRKTHKNGNVVFGPAIQLLNIDQLVDMCMFFRDISSDSPNIGFYSHVKYPIICDYDIAPTEYKLKVADQLETKLKEIKNERYVQDISTHVNGLRNESFTEEQKKTYQKMFIRYNDAQDRLRSNTKTWRELIPGLEQAIDR
jgi:MoaA/NifB/PqqE/SkfB family radical SAM enzyme